MLHPVAEQLICFYEIGNIDDFPKKVGRVVCVEETEVALFRLDDDQFYAVANRNPHPRGGTLVDGIVSDLFLYDPLYDWKISLVDGTVQAPDRGQVEVYPVVVEGKTVKLGLPACDNFLS
ncbi:nitrite reductase small subunit NirD [Brevibacillus laterosporus]|uniref:nitrite reductase small subunit NirD n=1 Tax=Brevibacillus laterosporus TaxID=1465 RepID=UPI00264CFFDA|nr:nitrite reductase small subunit NirD [Brevibacillus laterosporus]MDN9009827.1 nitrite reductase small subunit NirD [Brevibacillus laterosporus]MDO0940791.1 nitrite reductase small subunit NirD [Brevibacillus laterosporus]